MTTNGKPSPPRSEGQSQTVPQISVQSTTELQTVAELLRLRASGPVVVVTGGANGMQPPHVNAVATLLRTGLIEALDRWRAVVVDGGTDSGVMRLFGRLRAEHKASFALIGVAAAGTVAHQSQPDPAVTTNLDPHHSLALIVPGNHWGDESPWLSAVASFLAGGGPSVTLLINGGQLAYDDAEHSLAVGRPVVVLTGSGRSSDTISTARAGAPAEDRATAIARSQLVHTVAADRPDQVVRMLAGLLQMEEGPGSVGS